MNKRHVKIVSSVLVAAMIGGGSLPLLLNLNNSSSVVTSEEPKYNPISFEDNTQETFKDVKQSSLTIFNDLFPWKDFSNDPYDPMYQSIFEKIDTTVVANDAHLWLETIVNRNQANFKMNVASVEVIDNVQTYTNAKAFNLELKFSIYNNSASENTLLVNNVKEFLHFKPWQSIENTLTINSPIEYTFFQNNNDVHAGYAFKTAQWTFGNQVQSFKNFKFSNYSKTINTKITDVSMGQGYLEIKDFAQDYLSELTGEQIAQEVIDDNNALLGDISNNLQPVQAILQKLVQNKPTNQFLNDIAYDVKEVVDNLVAAQLPEVKNLGSLLADVLVDKTLFDIILNNKDCIVSLIGMIGLDVSAFTSIITDATKESLIDLFKSLTAILPPEMIELNDIIDQAETVGILTLIRSNTAVFSNLFTALLPAEGNLPELITTLLKIIDMNEQDKNILPLIIEIAQSKDSNNASILNTLFEMLLGSSSLSSLSTLLSQALYDNENLTVDKLKSTLNAIANPKTAKKGSTIVNYKAWWDSMEIISTIKQADYNQVDYWADIDVEVRFKFNRDLWINVDELVKILPPNMDIDGTSIPTGLIGSFVPGWVAIKSGDYVANNIKINNLIHYDVVNKNGIDVLSWQAGVHAIIDINMPQTVQVLWENSTIGTGDLIINLTKSMVYHKYSEYKHFKPRQSVLNNIEVKNYNRDKKYGVALVNPITAETFQQINTEITNNMQMVTLSEKYQWKSGSWIFQKTHTINKTEAKNTFDRSSLYSQFFKLTHGELTVPIYLEFNSEFIIPETKFLGGLFTIPEVLSNKVAFWSPMNLSVDNVLGSDWAYTLA